MCFQQSVWPLGLHTPFIVRCYQWGSWARHMHLFFLSTWGSFDCNNNQGSLLLCTHHWCTMQEHSETVWQLILRFLDPHKFRYWTADYKFWGRPYNSPRDRARLRAPSIAPHSWLPSRMLPPRGCCPDGSRWRCSCGWRRWRRCQRNQLGRWLWCFIDTKVKIIIQLLLREAII